MIRANSSAPISRMLVEQRIAEGMSYSSVVSANEACVQALTSKPSRFRASPSLLEKYTLLSISRIFAGRPGSIMRGPPHAEDLRYSHERRAVLASLPRDSRFQLRRHREKANRQHAANRIRSAASFPQRSARNLR